MKILLNGESRAVTEAKSISALVHELNLIPATLLIEHNGLALHREEWNSRALRDGDKVEFIRVVAGG
jgi:thiamine biosynthesis protein ThiS